MNIEVDVSHVKVYANDEASALVTFTIRDEEPKFRLTVRGVCVFKVFEGAPELLPDRWPTCLTDVLKGTKCRVESRRIVEEVLAQVFNRLAG